MHSLSVRFVGAALLIGSLQAQAASLNLGSDANSIKMKSQAIEKEYSRSMRMENQVSENSGHQGALTIEEGSAPVSNNVPPQYRDIRSIPGANNTYFSGLSAAHYDSTLKMRESRKVGLGLTAGGVSGAIGANLELNFEDADGVVAGFGTGPGYNAISLSWKHAFDGDYIAPYTTVGYSRWYNSRGRSHEYENSDILDRVLTDGEKKDGRFGTDFVNASIGLQYNQLSGDFAGLSFFGELVGMLEVKRSIIVPNGSIGALYYF
ncbi:hypothetical protein QJS83_02475 [Bdellovibrio sp. 22V]|uniref:hypothetical protein n=1 Tax=Bdellovibrio TaxID=958 RepID=UPI0025433EE8|nr:hypothetical protein [Bdellovibrio sp. 22V]WII72734.1 hypothetical protein QJS83_02475 [Bdellovibrio sp. 22V]